VVGNLNNESNQVESLLADIGRCPPLFGNRPGLLRNLRAQIVNTSQSVFQIQTVQDPFTVDIAASNTNTYLDVGADAGELYLGNDISLHLYALPNLSALWALPNMPHLSTPRLTMSANYSISFR